MVSLLFFFILGISGYNIHIIFGNHFDAGFAMPDLQKPGYLVNIINLYINNYFDQALKNIQDLKKYNISYIFTTHAWLIYIYLNCEPNLIPEINNYQLICPNKTKKSEFIWAIKNGYITWHALPFNIQSESANNFIISENIKFVHELDESFGLSHKTVISRWDIPGLTSGAIPIFNKYNITAISLGINPMAAAPNMPPVSRWQDPVSNSEIILLNHPNGYGGYNPENLLIIPNFTEILGFYWRGDNEGPGDIHDILFVLNNLKTRYPESNIFPSSFEKYISKLIPIKNNLPVINTEIGDTWIHGLSTDPKKIAEFRLISRYLEKNSDKINKSSQIYKKIRLLLLKIPEHTWGLDQKIYLSDDNNWNNKKFRSNLNNTNFKNIINSWLEQREYIPKNLIQYDFPELYSELLEFSELYNNLKKLISKNIRVDNISNPYWNFMVGTQGNILNLESKINKKIIITDIKFIHQVFNSADYNNYIENYTRCGALCPLWVYYDFAKIGLSGAKTNHNNYYPITQNFTRIPGQNIYIISANSYNKSNFYGPPKNIFLILELINQTDINLYLILENKTATRLPEAFWLSFKPNINNNNGWFINKIQNLIPINNFVKNGSFHLHGSWDGIFNFDKQVFNIKSLDIPVISLDYLTPFPIPFLSDKNNNLKLNITNGINFLLWNNIWGTNFPLWYPFVPGDKNLVFRFNIKFF